MKELLVILKPTNLFAHSVKAIMWFILSLELIRILLYTLEDFPRLLFSESHGYSLIVKVLNLLVLYEILITLTSAFELRRIKLTYVVDTAVIFFIRELVVLTFSKKGIDLQPTLAYIGIILSLGVLRVIAVRFSPHP